MREAYARRVALGRGADVAPDWSVLEDEGVFEVVDLEENLPEDIFAVENQGGLWGHADPSIRDIHRNQQFNDRGRPVNIDSRLLDADLCYAQNVAQQIAAANMAKETPHERQQEHLIALQREEKLRSKLVDYFLWMEFAARHWLDAAEHRWITLKSHGDLPFVQSLAMDFRAKGFWDFAFGGFLPYCISAEASDRLEEHLSKLDEHFRLMAWPSLPKYLSGAAVVNTLRASVQVFFFGPLSVWTHLQTTGLVPGMPILPPPRFFNPLSSYSPFQPFRLHWTMLFSPLAIQLAFDNIDKLVSTHFFPIMDSIYYVMDDWFLMLEAADDESDEMATIAVQETIVEELNLLGASQPNVHLTTGDADDNPLTGSQPFLPISRAGLDLALKSSSRRPFSLVSSLRRATAFSINKLLLYFPGRPSSWTVIDTDRAFRQMHSSRTDWSATPFAADLGAAPLNRSLGDCSDFIWRQLVTYPLYIVADALVLRSLASSFLAGNTAPALLAHGGKLAATPQLGPGSVFGIWPTFSLSRFGRPQRGVFHAVWRATSPFVAAWALRAAVGVAVCAVHAAVVGYLIRRRSRATREALNWRDGGRRDWS